MHRRLLFFCVVMIQCSSFTAFGQSDTISWKPNALQWNDFKKVINPSGNHDAFTYSGISFEMFEEDDTVQVIVYSYFDRSQSWVRPGHTNDTLLAHEQLHFDITELYARKMRVAMRPYMNKSYKEFVPGKYDEKVMAIFREVYNEQIMRQQNYDVETAHGQRDAEQARWREMIRKELDSLEAEK